MKLNRGYSIAWAVWLAFFGVVEARAVVRKRQGDTLSEHVWYALRFPVMRFTFAGFWAWLTLHFFTRRV